MHELLKDVDMDLKVEAVDVIGKVIVIRTKHLLPPESLKVLQEYYSSKGALGVIVLRPDDKIEYLTRDQLEGIGFKPVDFLSELEEIE